MYFLNFIESSLQSLSLKDCPFLVTFTTEWTVEGVQSTSPRLFDRGLWLPSTWWPLRDAMSSYSYTSTLLTLYHMQFTIIPVMDLITVMSSILIVLHLPVLQCICSELITSITQGIVVGYVTMLLCVFSMYKAGCFVYQNKFKIVKIWEFSGQCSLSAKSVHIGYSVLFGRH